MSIDMGIKNLAFCDAEITCQTPTSAARRSLGASMKVMRWKKLDLVDDSSSTTRALNERGGSQDTEEDAAVEEDDSHFAPSVLSKTAYKLITEEVLSVNPDIILIEKQRWRSGGGSAVQQWTVRVNTLEAMLWAVLETIKRKQESCSDGGKALVPANFEVCAVDPKRVGQYWLGQHARSLSQRDECALAHDMSTPAVGVNESDGLEETDGKPMKRPGRSKAEKSAKIAVLREWLAEDIMSTVPSTPASMPRITFSIDPGAEATRQALLAKVKAPRKKKSPRVSKTTDAGVELAEELPAAEIKKLDDITDCFLQAAAWVAWELNRSQLLAALDGDRTKVSSSIDEVEISRMIEEVGGV